MLLESLKQLLRQEISATSIYLRGGQVQVCLKVSDGYISNAVYDTHGLPRIYAHRVVAFIHPRLTDSNGFVPWVVHGTTAPCLG